MTWEIINNAISPVNYRFIPNRKVAFKTRQKTYEGKPCPKCGETKRYTQSKKCFKCIRNWNRTQDKQKHALVKRNWQLKSTYGITLIQFNELLKEQNNLCKLCGNQLKPDRTTHVDHCHETKKIRGLLCHSCNIGIGHLRHNPELLRKAALYCEVV